MTVVTPTYPSQFFKLESFGLISKSNVCRKNHTGIGRSKQVQGKLNCIRIYFILNTWILFIFGNGHFSHSLAQSNDQLTNSTHVSVPCSLGNIYQPFASRYLGLCTLVLLAFNKDWQSFLIFIVIFNRFIRDVYYIIFLCTFFFKSILIVCLIPKAIVYFYLNSGPN